MIAPVTEMTGSIGWRSYLLLRGADRAGGWSAAIVLPAARSRKLPRRRGSSSPAGARQRQDGRRSMQAGPPSGTIRPCEPDVPAPGDSPHDYP
jgi:hypothetical protein